MAGRTEKVQENAVSPASYQDAETLKFGKNLKNITIGERRPAKEKETIGPGVYEVEKADKVTKYNCRTINFEDQIGRQDT